jgi:hypothetical protein
LDLLEKLGIGRSSVPTCTHHPCTLEEPEVEGGGDSTEKIAALDPATEERYEEMDATSGEPENVDDNDAYHNHPEALGIDLSPLPVDRHAEEIDHLVPKNLMQGKPSPITPAWMARYNEAKEFKAQHEHLQVPRNTQLSNWLHWQRRTNAQGTLVTQKKALLDELGFQWIFPILSPKWLASYNEAKTFHTRHGHLQGAPAAHTTLAKWLRMQRRQAKTSDAYPAEKKELLDSLGFQWTTPIISSDWMVRYTDLKAFKTRTGHTNVPSRTPLYDWMKQQLHAQAKGTIAVEKKMLLDGLEALHGEGIPLA